jgi:hypothetical protein
MATVTEPEAHPLGPGDKLSREEFLGGSWVERNYLQGSLSC